MEIAHAHCLRMEVLLAQTGHFLKITFIFSFNSE